MKRQIQAKLRTKKLAPWERGGFGVRARPIGEATKNQDLSRLAASSPTPICQNAPLNTSERATMFGGGEKG